MEKECFPPKIRNKTRISPHDTSIQHCTGVLARKIRQEKDIKDIQIEKEEVKVFLVSLKLNIQKTKIMASSPITSWQIDGETMTTVRLYFGGLQNHC